MLKLIVILVIMSVPLTSAGAEIDLGIIAQIESSNNPNAYNKASQAYGLYQITPICLADYNQYHATGEISKDALSSVKLQEKVASWYLFTRIPSLLKFYGHEINETNQLIAFNCGVNCLKRKTLPTETTKYLEKYRSLSHERAKDTAKHLPTTPNQRQRAS